MMQTRHVDQPNFTIRPLETSAERDAYARLMIQTFSSHLDAQNVTPQWRRFFENEPLYQSHQYRGAFLGETLLGGCHVFARVMRIGSARLLTACIGGVVTLSEHRNQGVAAALLRDVVQYAQQQHFALILLDGISDFYHRFGFIDIFDVTYQTILSSDVQQALATNQSPYKIHQATFEDIPALFNLYQLHYGQLSGSFERDQAFQERYFHDRSGVKPYLATNEKGKVQGYLMINKRPDKLMTYEVAANDQAAALALLQQNATLLKEFTGTEDNVEIAWPLPSTSSTYYALSDILTIQSRVTHKPDADWMARTAHLPTLIEALLPLWNERWQSHNIGRSGVLSIVIEKETFLFGADNLGIHLLDPMTSSAHAARQIIMSQQVFTQVLFGYRSISWAMKQPGQVIPDDLLHVLDILFAGTTTWIAGTDNF